MNIKRNNIRYIIGLGLLWSVLAGFYAYKGAFDSLALWFVLPLMYAPLVFFSWRSNHLILFLFVLISTATNTITPAYFFLNKDDFSSSGWNSVNKFQFFVGDYLFINNYLWLFLALVIVLSLLINEKIFITPKYNKVLPVGKHSAKSESKGKPKDNILLSKILNRRIATNGIILMFLITCLSFLNSWMFGRGMSITGLDASQELLPFKLNGILYYFTRFIVPIIIFYLYSRSSRSLVLTILITLYATFAGLSQVSRTTFILILFPAIYFALKDNKYIRLSIIGISSLILISIITQARNFVYLVVGGIATKGHDEGLFSLMRNVFEKFEDYDLSAVFFSMLNRVGGAQDIVLGFQYDTSTLGGCWANFCRIFLWASDESLSLAQYELYGFMPPAGFSTGSGGFSSQILQIAGGNLIVLSIVAFWVGLWISLGDKILSELIRIFGGLNVAFVFAFFFVFMFFAAGHMSWFYAFISFALLVVVCTRKPITLHHRAKIPVVV